MSVHLKLAPLALLLICGLLQANNAAGIGFNMISQNLTIVYNALERVGQNDYGFMVEDMLLVSDSKVIFDAATLANVTYYLSDAQGISQHVVQLYPGEVTCINETLAQMPTSTLNLMTKASLCFRNVLYGDNLATYIDTRNDVIRVLSGKSHNDDRNIVWHVTGSVGEYINMTIANDAFWGEPVKSSLYMRANSSALMVDDVHIDIGLILNTEQIASIWTFEPDTQGYFIKNSATRHYICGSQQSYNAEYRYVSGILYPQNMRSCLWAIVDCSANAGYMPYSNVRRF